MKLPGRTGAVLLVSLALNLVFLGAVIGHFLWGPPPGAPVPNLGWIVRHLDDSTREKLQPQLSQLRQKAAPLSREMRQAQQDFETALLDPALSEEQLDQVLTRLRDASQGLQTEMHEQMVGLIRQLDPEERMRLVQFLQQHGRDRRHPEPTPPDASKPRPDILD